MSWKSIHWEPRCYMWADGRTDMTKLIVTFRNFSNPPKNMVVTTSKNDNCLHIFRQIKNQLSI
jgi:hypothetical protein